MRYSKVIIDLPSILAGMGSSIIGQLADATSMALKADALPMREIEVSVKRLKQPIANFCRLLFNDVNIFSTCYGAGKYCYQYSYES